MTKENNYVDCQHCQGWTDTQRRKIVCNLCNNTRRAIDPKDILCNLCGGNMCPLGTHNEQYPHGLYNAKVTGGYDSYHLLDMNDYTFNFCEKCLRQLFVQCKIKPVVSNDGSEYVISTLEERWDLDQQSYEYRVWTDDGGYHQAYLNRKCNVEKDCPNDAAYTYLYNEEFTEACCCEEHKNDGLYLHRRLVKFIPNTLKAFL